MNRPIARHARAHTGCHAVVAVLLTLGAAQAGAIVSFDAARAKRNWNVVAMSE